MFFKSWLTPINCKYVLLDNLYCEIYIPFLWDLNPDAGSKPHADSSLKKSGSSKETIPGNTEPGTEDVNGGCTLNYKGTSFYFGDGLLVALRRSWNWKLHYVWVSAAVHLIFTRFIFLG